jgi:hypothetical protein
MKQQNVALVSGSLKTPPATLMVCNIQCNTNRNCRYVNNFKSPDNWSFSLFMVYLMTLSIIHFLQWMTGWLVNNQLERYKCSETAVVIMDYLTMLHQLHILCSIGWNMRSQEKFGRRVTAYFKPPLRNFSQTITGDSLNVRYKLLSDFSFIWILWSNPLTNW